VAALDGVRPDGVPGAVPTGERFGWGPPRLGRVTRIRPRAIPPLPSRPSAGVLIGGFLAGLEQAITNRPPVVAQIEEPIGRERFERHGFAFDGLDEPVERREPHDRSGARL
jgi:hypothetical protein